MWSVLAAMGQPTHDVDTLWRRARSSGAYTMARASALRGGDSGRYERAAVRWLGRFALEGRNVTIGDLRLAAEALDALPERAAEAMERLQQLCLARGVG